MFEGISRVYHLDGCWNFYCIHHWLVLGCGRRRYPELLHLSIKLILTRMTPVKHFTKFWVPTSFRRFGDRYDEF